MHARTLGLSVAVLIAAAMPAHAYLDPGTGSIIAQAVIGAVVAAGVFARVWWARLRSLLGLAKPARGTDGEEQG
jgi:hypothetical protein